VTGASRDQLARVVRQHAGQLTASLMQVTGDFAAGRSPAPGFRTGSPPTTSWAPA